MTALWFIIAFPLAFVVHEAGHFAGGAIASLRVAFLSIGVGPVIARFRLAQTEIELCALPLGGHVLVGGDERAGRLRLAVFILGGVTANAVLIAIIALMDSMAGPSLPEFVRDGFSPMVFVQLYFIVINLIPFRYDLDGAIIGSDGMQLVRLLRGMPLSDAGPAYREALHVYGGGTPSAASPIIMRQMARLDAWRDPIVRREACAALQRALEIGDTTTAERLLILDFLITVGLITGDPELRHHLRTWSQRAEALDPRIATLQGSRGAVLVETGQYAAGKALLESAAARPLERTADLSITQLFLARAEAALGHPAAAHAYLSQARAAIHGDESLAWLRQLAERIERELPTLADAV